MNALNNLFSLEGKTAIVTGCSRGIGFAIAGGLAQAGADITGVSASMPADGGLIGEKVRALGKTFVAHACDFSDLDAVRELARKLNAEAPPQILVNNAGTIMRKPAAEHPDDYWFRTIDVNLNAQFILAREIGAGMIARKSGKIIFTASLLSFQGGITVPGYTASKHGIAGLTKALANEWAGQGVNVNAIAPGYIETDNTEALRKDEARHAAILARIPAGRWGLPSDIAGAAIFLASKAADYVHGEIITVDGGWMGR